MCHNELTVFAFYSTSYEALSDEFRSSLKCFKISLNADITLSDVII